MALSLARVSQDSVALINNNALVAQHQRPPLRIDGPLFAGLVGSGREEESGCQKAMRRSPQKPAME